MGLPAWVEVHEKWDLTKRTLVGKVVKDHLMEAFASGIPINMTTEKGVMTFTINSLEREDGSNESYNFEGFDKFSSIKGWSRTDRLAGYVQRVYKGIVVG